MSAAKGKVATVGKKRNQAQSRVTARVFVPFQSKCKFLVFKVHEVHSKDYFFLFRPYSSSSLPSSFSPAFFLFFFFGGFSGLR